MSSTILIVATLLLVAFVTYKMFARETGFRIMSPTQDGKPRFAIPDWVKKISLASSKEFSDRSLWVCIVVGAIGFHWFHNIYPLFVCMIIRSFFLPTTTFSVAARWAYIIAMVVFYFLPGIETYSVAKWDNLKTATTQMGTEAKTGTTQASPHTQPQTVEAPIESFQLTGEWLGPFAYPPSGGLIMFECAKLGAEVRIEFDSAQNAIVYSGQVVQCPLRGQKIMYGNMIVNGRYYFRSNIDMELRIQGAVHGPV